MTSILSMRPLSKRAGSAVGRGGGTFTGHQRHVFTALRPQKRTVASRSPQCDNSSKGYPETKHPCRADLVRCRPVDCPRREVSPCKVSIDE